VAVQLLSFLRRTYVKGFLQILLIAVFTIKSCDTFIEYYSSLHKSEVENLAGDESSDVSEENFEKLAKKVYSCFEFTTSFRPFTSIIPLSTPWCVYSFSIFAEPLRVVLTPPPNSMA